MQKFDEEKLWAYTKMLTSKTFDKSFVGFIWKTLSNDNFDEMLAIYQILNLLTSNIYATWGG